MYRIETDGIGQYKVPKDAYYGIHTARAIDNFSLTNCKSTNLEIIRALAIVKLAAVRANLKASKIDKEKVRHIELACERVYNGEFDTSFLIPSIQGGAGTSTNMNLNEVIANIAIESLGGKLGDYSIIHPIEDINLSQSTNDTYPTAIKIASIKVLRELVDEAMKLQDALQTKEKEFSHIYKLGRTQLQDAVPLTLGQTFSAFGEAISRDRWRLYKIEERLRRINIGGTAIGTGVGAPLKYRFYISEELKRLTGYGLARAENLIDATQNLDVFVEVSSLAKTLATSLNKIANDLRLMSSGPYGGLGEINLPPIQMGSSIMPGKVNPVGAEFIKQIFYKVHGNDLIITSAVAHGELELNSMTPLIAESFLESLELLRDGIRHFTKDVIIGITANESRCEEILRNSLSTITKHLDTLGYDELSDILKECEKTGKTYEEVLTKRGLI